MLETWFLTVPSANAKLAGIYAVCAAPWACVWLVIFADLWMRYMAPRVDRSLGDE